MVQLGSRVRVTHACQSQLARNGATFEACRFQAGTLQAVTAAGLVLDPADEHRLPVQLSFNGTKRVEVSRGQRNATFGKWGVLGLIAGAGTGWIVGALAEFTACGLNCDGSVTTVATVVGGVGGFVLGVRSGRHAEEGWRQVPLRQVRRLGAPTGAVFPLTVRIPF